MECGQNHTENTVSGGHEIRDVRVYRRANEVVGQRGMGVQRVRRQHAHPAVRQRVAP